MFGAVPRRILDRLRRARQYPDHPPAAGPTTPAGAKRALGAAKERLAQRYLERAGLTTVAVNVSCRHGELDLVMRDDATLVFVEVRYRQSEGFGGATASVDHRKRARLCAAAAWYLQRHPTTLPCRFDVLAIGDGDRVQWIRHAFDQT